MKVQIGSKTFDAELEDNATATAFKALLPLSAEMIELHGDEKYSKLPEKLPTNASNPGMIHAGDQPGSRQRWVPPLTLQTA